MSRNTFSRAVLPRSGFSRSVFSRGVFSRGAHLALAGRATGARRAVVTASARARAAGRDAGMATAEYAIATLAACGFAGLLLAILSGGQVRTMLLGIVKRALSVG